MATWQKFEEEAGELAQDVRRVFEAAVSHVLATLRKDGSPRVSGIEVQFPDTGEMTFGSMLKAVKAYDLLRDPRFALHSSPTNGTGDAKISGRAIEVQTTEDSYLFRFDIQEVVYTAVSEDQTHLVIRHWQPGGPPKVVQRY